MDQVVLVDEQDHVIGVMDKIEAHRGDAKLHRAISVFLFNEKGELLIQQRSETKIVGALQWANTCCGNVLPEETYLQCAKRRLRVELGINDVKLQEVTKFQYHVRCNEEFSENEIDTVFVGKYHGLVSPNPVEVKNFRWCSYDEFTNNVRYKSTTYAPWIPFLLANVKDIQMPI